MEFNFFTESSGAEVYFFGGALQDLKLTTSINFLNISTEGKILNSKSGVAQMPEAKYDSCGVTYKDRYVFIIGGLPYQSGTLSRAYIFDSKTLAVSTVFTLAKPRWSPVCTVLNSTIIIAGGGR